MTHERWRCALVRFVLRAIPLHLPSCVDLHVRPGLGSAFSFMRLPRRGPRGGVRILVAGVTSCLVLTACDSSAPDAAHRPATGQPAPSRATQRTSNPHPSSAFKCPTTGPVHRSRPPAGGFSASARATWVRLNANPSAVAVLPNSTNNRVVMDLNGDKILWAFRSGRSPLVIINGSELTTGRPYHLQSQGGGITIPGEYSTIVNFPTAGCWRLTAVVGQQRGSIVVTVA